MIHPSYSELMNVINNDVEPGEQPPVQSRYSIVIATSKSKTAYSRSTCIYKGYQRQETFIYSS